jgi:hypothetical protein
MAQKQNPTAEGRALWNALDGASAETLTLYAYRAQYLIGNCSVRPELAAMLAALAFGGGACHG